jgi:hypothetical protein
VTEKFVVADGITINTDRGEDYKFSLVVDTSKFGGNKEDEALFVEEVGIIENEVNDENKLEYHTSVDDVYSEFKVDFDTPSSEKTIRGQIKAQEWNEDKSALIDGFLYYVTKPYSVGTDDIIVEVK